MKVCDNCGSEKIQQVWSVYIPMNEPESLEDVPSSAWFAQDDYWCPDCEECGIMWEKEKE